jgi:hypothetical protein
VYVFVFCYDAIIQIIQIIYNRLKIGVKMKLSLKITGILLIFALLTSCVAATENKDLPTKEEITDFIAGIPVSDNYVITIFDTVKDKQPSWNCDTWVDKNGDKILSLYYIDPDSEKGYGSIYFNEFGEEISHGVEGELENHYIGKEKETVTETEEETKDTPTEETKDTTIEETKDTPTEETKNTTTEETTQTSTHDNKGVLDILTSPTGATVTIDGGYEGLSPMKGLSMNAGTHTVDLDLAGYNAKTLTVHLANSETKEILWTFVPVVNESQTPISTSNPTPTETPQPTPVPSSASVSLQGEKTKVVNGDEIRLKLSAVNLITKPIMHVQVIIIPPSGMSISSSELIESGAGQYTTTYDLEPGQGKDIEVNILANQAGNFDVKGRAVYYFGENKKDAEDQTLNCPIQVEEVPESSIPTSTPTPTLKTPFIIPGLGVTSLVMILMMVFFLRRK